MQSGSNALARSACLWSISIT